MNRRLHQVLLAIVVALAAGCSADRPLNPSFPLTLDQARVAMKQMNAKAVPLQRPVIVVGGYHDFGLASGNTRSRVEGMVSHPSVINVTMVGGGGFDSAAARLIAAVEKAFPCSDPNWTSEVDVIGMSMGGLVARYAAMPVNGTNSADADRSSARAGAEFANSGSSAYAGSTASVTTTASRALPPKSEREPHAAATAAKRLRMARLFTISTPHRGANLAPLVFFDPLAIDMRQGSPFLAKLDAALPDAGYELFAYVRLGDELVGEENAAPPGMHAWWVQNQPLQFSHMNCGRDERILADIARRLRGEKPYATSPPAGLP